ncbi:hypothetical protein F0562_033921 [Nyssa sinensis]|uniref:FBD domain-containing protein n=1 Tax=Nyssa sinensis TaxID=561372 RepID=A0A5J5AFA4_9ASTE|nr:hypothetical protein F0562_033921 [Nyssa sinensis]
MSSLDEVMSCLPGVVKLYMGDCILKASAAGGVPKTLAKTANFLKSSLNLQELEIWASTSAGAAMEPILNFMEKQDCADCTLGQLRKVMVQGVRGLEPELVFVKYLLSRSPMLELMNIVHNEDIDSNAELRM